MPLKKFFAVLAAACLVFGMVGCQQNGAGIKTAEMKTIEPPESGWTHEQLSEVMYLCGESFSLPCKLEDISDKFKCGELKAVDDGYITVNGEKTSYYEMSLMYNDELVGKSWCYDDGNEKIVFAVQIRSMVVKEQLLVLNGIYQETDFKRTTEALGVKIYNREDMSMFNYIYDVLNPEYPEEKIYLTSTDEEIILFFTYSLFEFKKNND